MSTLSNNSICENMYLNGYIVTRIVYELIKNYMVSNPPASCGIQLAQSYNLDPTQSQIFLDIAYNWQASKTGKVPAIYVQRGSMQFKSPTVGLMTGVDEASGSERRRVFTTMPVTVTCVAAEPLAVVENLAEYVKQPLLYFRKEVEIDFSLRRFAVTQISPPALDGAGKNNFVVNIGMDIVFDEGWVISRESMKLRRVGLALFDSVMQPLQTIVV